MDRCERGRLCCRRDDRRVDSASLTTSMEKSSHLYMKVNCMDSTSLTTSMKEI
jgi:hypothetical protein